MHANVRMGMNVGLGFVCLFLHAMWFLQARVSQCQSVLVKS